MNAEIADFLRYGEIARRLAPLTCRAYSRDVRACEAFLASIGITDPGRGQDRPSAAVPHRRGRASAGAVEPGAHDRGVAVLLSLSTRTRPRCCAFDLPRTPDGTRELVLVETQPGVTIEQIREHTAVDFRTSIASGGRAAR